MDAAQATMAQRTDENKATAAERESMRTYSDAINLCDTTLVSIMQNYAPPIGKVMSNYLPLYRDNETNLVMGRESWGEFVVRTAELNRMINDENAQAFQSIKDGFEQRYANEVQQSHIRNQEQAEALNNFANYMQRQQAINNANRPVTTNCSGGRNGGMVTCTTF
ncbi:hypothetical protein PQR57_29350 [Paraburkholderia dipogonis]|uniref:Phasin family protein n=2 Tax=Paraburkholderia TaxID=1822464 RepID=A0ABW9AZ23_9BURK